MPESGMPATQVDLDVVAPGQGRAAAVAHGLDVDPLVARGGIAVVDPEERADLQLLAGQARASRLPSGVSRTISPGPRYRSIS